VVPRKHLGTTAAEPETAEQLAVGAHEEDQKTGPRHGKAKLSEAKRARYTAQLNHPDPKVAIEGIASLAHRQAMTPALGKKVLTLIKSSNDVELKKTGVWAISRSGMDNVEAELATFGLTETNGRVGSRVIDALVTLKNDKARDGLVSLMKGAEVKTVRRRSAMMLGMVGKGQPGVLQALTTTALKDADAAVRSSAIRALGVSTSAAAMGALKTISEAAPTAADREAAEKRLARTQARLGSAAQLVAQFHSPQHPRRATAKQFEFHGSEDETHAHH